MFVNILAGPGGGNEPPVVDISQRLMFSRRKIFLLKTYFLKSGVDGQDGIFKLERSLSHTLYDFNIFEKLWLFATFNLFHFIKNLQILLQNPIYATT